MLKFGLRLSLFFVLLFGFGINVNAQYTQMATKKEKQVLKEEKKDTSYVAKKYPYIFPILGQKTTESGFDLPYPHGFMANGIYTQQRVALNDLKVNIDDGSGLDLSPATEYMTTNTKVYASNFRLDTYLLPFLNVYGIGGSVNTVTTVGVDLPAGTPFSTNFPNRGFNKDVKFETVTENKGYYYGAGFMAAGGIGKYWVSADLNYGWADLDLLDKPSRTRVLGLRIGRAFKLNDKPHQNISFWFAAQNQTIFNETNGSIALRELGLESDKTFYYSFNKSLVQPWHFSAGTQYQLNKNWQFRIEVGASDKEVVDGDKKRHKQQYMGMINYRFGAKGHNMLSETLQEQEEYRKQYLERVELEEANTEGKVYYPKKGNY